MEKLLEALKYVNGKIADLEDDLQHYTMVDKDKCKEFYIREDLKQFTNIQQALTELKAIKEAKPSEAMRILEHIIHSNNLEWMPEIIREDVKSDLGIVKQALLKAQEQEEDIIHYKGTIANLRRDNALLKDIKNEQEKVLEIVFEKPLSLLVLKLFERFETPEPEYEFFVEGYKAIREEINEDIKEQITTEEEFDLLKRWSEK